MQRDPRALIRWLYCLVTTLPQTQPMPLMCAPLLSILIQPWISDSSGIHRSRKRIAPGEMETIITEDKFLAGVYKRQIGDGEERVLWSGRGV